MGRNTGKKLYVRLERLGWNFDRTIWCDADGGWFIKVNGSPVEMSYVYDNADEWMVW